MLESRPNLIVGAGPVGLAAALFLARQGHMPRLVEQRAEPSAWSKALAVNPRTLEILEPTGVTARMLEIGRPIRGLQLHRGESVLAELRFDGIHPRFPFMLALSQATSERLLSEALTAAGGRVERGLKLAGCRATAEVVEAVLEPAAGGDPQAMQCEWMLAADGARSTARQSLGLSFSGSTFAREWHLADVPLETDLLPDWAHVFLLEHGEFLFTLPVVDEASPDAADRLVWRVMGNAPNPVERLPRSRAAGPASWVSSFHIGHRIASSLAAGGVYLAGDAAHIHSPVGARGMNLGIEDAWVFSELVRTRRLEDYDALRRPVDRNVVRQVERISRIVSGESSFDRFLRSTMLPLAVRMPAVRRLMLRTVTGQDHPLPSFPD